MFNKLAEEGNQQEDASEVLSKSRNFNKVQLSRSGDEQRGIEKNSNNYKNFLFMGDSKKKGKEENYFSQNKESKD